MDIDKALEETGLTHQQFKNMYNSFMKTNVPFKARKYDSSVAISLI